MEMINRFILVLVLTSLSMGIALTTIIGYLFEKSWMYDWTSKTAMSFPSAVAILANGIAVLLVAILDKEKKIKS